MDIIHLLLDRGADSNVRNKASAGCDLQSHSVPASCSYWTELDPPACDWTCPCFVALQEGKTPLQMAEVLKRTDVLDLLRKGQRVPHSPGASEVSATSTCLTSGSDLATAASPCLCRTVWALITCRLPRAGPTHGAGGNKDPPPRRSGCLESSGSAHGSQVCRQAPSAGGVYR